MMTEGASPAPNDLEGVWRVERKREKGKDDPFNAAQRNFQRRECYETNNSE